MNELIAKMWVNALRSGEYQQGKSTLHNQDTNTYCCLGVLCDLYVQENDNRDTYCHQRMLSDSSIVTCFGDATGTLPEEVRTWSGINDDNGQFKYNKSIPGRDTSYFRDEDTCLLTSMNDGEYGHDFTFEEIANIIEEQWRQL